MRLAIANIIWNDMILMKDWHTLSFDYIEYCF